MIANATVPRLASVAAQALQRRTYFSVTSSLPQVRVSLAEKTAHGLAIFFGVIAYPIWVVSHVREYKGGH
uniref:Cytochrome c oxidase polypeptide VIII n=1 Tax=Anopheles minimus TaxID=112268 RepID=A0A182W375_9DIPT